MGSLELRRAWTAAILSAVGVLWVSGARAEDAEPVHLTYEVPAGCPGEIAFLDLVARDGGRLAAAWDAQSARSFIVHVEEGDSVSGRLTVRDRDGTDAEQSIEGGRCDDVVRSLAVLVALATGPSPQPTPSPLAEWPLPDTSAPATSAPAAPDLDSEATPDPFLVRPPEGGPPQGWHMDLSGEGTLSQASSPSLEPALALYVELLHETPSLLAASVRVGVEFAAEQGDVFAPTFQRTVGRADACTFRLQLARPWSDDAFTLEPCARIDVGRFEVGRPNPSNAGMTVASPTLWVAAAALGRLRWTSPRFFAEFEGGVVFPLTRVDYFFWSAPGFRAPVAALTTGLGFGVFL